MFFFASLCHNSSSALYWHVLASNEGLIESMVEKSIQKILPSLDEVAGLLWWDHRATNKHIL